MARFGFCASSPTMPQFLYNSARDGCTSPRSSVQRDWITASSPSQAQSKLKRVCAFGSTGACSFASFQLRPPSVDTSTLLTAPPPDQANPVIWTYPLPAIFSPPEGRVITDFGPHSKWNQRDLPSRSALSMVEWFTPVGSRKWSTSLIWARYFTLKSPSQPGTISRNG